jgi:glycerate 2-kinase
VPPPPGRRVFAIAVGKAAAPMARALVDDLGAGLAGGLVIAPDAMPLPPLHVRAGRHPVPDATSEAAGREALSLARQLKPDDALVVLLSGGASALMVVPAEGLTLDDKRAATAQLLKAGADIEELNTVRKHLSAIKGGRLAAATPARVLTLAISDVVGDDLSVIGSGPTMPDPSSFADAAAVIARRGGWTAFPGSVRRVIEEGLRGERPESPKPGDARLRDSVAQVIGSRREAMAGAAAEARARGYHVVVHETAVVGEARAAGPARLASAREAAARGLGPLCMISSGETTVTVTGNGKGGRNQELALSVVDIVAVAAHPALVASVGTDGVDGPTDAAGALIDPGTARRAALAGAPAPDVALRNNDAFRYLGAAGDLVKTGPTGTNVGDLQVILIP